MPVDVLGEMDGASLGHHDGRDVEQNSISSTKTGVCVWTARPTIARMANEGAPVGAIESHAQIERDLPTLADRSPVRSARAEDRVVERALDSGLERGVQGAEPADIGRCLAVGVVSAFQLDHTFGQRPGLIGAQDVHAAQVLDGTQAPDEDAVTGHHPGAARQVHAENGRQQLGTESHRQGD